MGPKLSVSVRVDFGEAEDFDRAIYHIYGFQTHLRRRDTNVRTGTRAPGQSITLHHSRRYFLRKRSSRTTSAPSVGLSGSSSDSFAGLGRADVAGRGAASSSSAGVAAPSEFSNCRPNCTEGSKKLLMEAKGTTRRSGIPPNDRPTSKRSSVTTRSQNWC